ncbi:MAG TPA: hypothetical protein VLD59_18690 [Steroidobacteraceae bacterium]|jgi:hypothetical protein|nr:hypothetical protein [Steroidobacteraceae bacterium]
MTEWLKLMLEEIARKQHERERSSAETAQRAAELESSPPERRVAPARAAKPARPREP